MLIALVPLVVVPAFVVARLYGFSWYATAGLFYVALAVVQIGYFGIIVLLRMGNRSAKRSCAVEDEVRTPG